MRTDMDVTWASAGEVRSGALDLAARLRLQHRERPRCVFAFVSPRCDLAAVGAELRALSVPVIACTTAGQIGRNGFEHGDVTAAAVFDDALAVQTHAIDSLEDLERSVARAAAGVLASGVLYRDDVKVFGVVIVDGLAGVEERLMEALNRRLPLLPIVGGSAGDELAFARTHVFANGAFRTGAAVLHVFSTSRRMVLLKIQHHQPTARRMVVTEADPRTRRLIALDGEPAAKAYADAVGVSVPELDAALVAKHPLMLRIARGVYTRSIREVRPDGTLQLYCAIERGLVVRLGHSNGIVSTLESAFSQAVAEVGSPVLALGLDCVLRRVEIERDQLEGEVGRVLADHNVIGFSTYGEQHNAVHANQTFTGFMLGDLR